MVLHADRAIMSGTSAKEVETPHSAATCDWMNPSAAEPTPNGHELNVKRPAGDESAVASAPPPTSSHARHGSPAAAQQACPSA